MICCGSALPRSIETMWYKLISSHAFSICCCGSLEFLLFALAAFVMRFVCRASLFSYSFRPPRWARDYSLVHWMQSSRSINFANDSFQLVYANDVDLSYSYRSRAIAQAINHVHSCLHRIHRFHRTTEWDVWKECESRVNVVYSPPTFSLKIAFSACIRTDKKPNWNQLYWGIEEEFFVDLLKNVRR